MLSYFYNKRNAFVAFGMLYAVRHITSHPILKQSNMKHIWPNGSMQLIAYDLSSINMEMQKYMQKNVDKNGNQVEPGIREFDACTCQLANAISWPSIGNNTI